MIIQLPLQSSPLRPGVLIVEDDLLIAIGNAAAVTEIGCEVAGIAATAAEAQAIAEHRRPELAVIDITLAGAVDGIELARRLVARHDLRVIFASALGDPATCRRAAAIGPAGILQKPFSDRALQTLVRDVLAQGRAIAAPQHWTAAAQAG